MKRAIASIGAVLLAAASLPGHASARPIAAEIDELPVARTWMATCRRISHWAVQPPSMLRLAPVIALASSRQR